MLTTMMEREAMMTVIQESGGTDFRLVCDGCGNAVEHLGVNLHNWELAWSFVKRHGWIGDRSRRGPHGCPRCTVRAARTID
ncbi:hypothetical protein [Dactylosporangium matsuzakiense]|uniref:hypothetical protein n=1 Tax=Dactylosporangium matsuzakiense TaxID=53360 RepID=UPI0021C3ED7B|nr:hypothetical protein [Dactylosporangium matsuzakiense]UWZ42253.1 hypothetical protein Dmats_32365 [Dactylosporangium matsuzakiense]